MRADWILNLERLIGEDRSSNEVAGNESLLRPLRQDARQSAPGGSSRAGGAPRRLVASLTAGLIVCLAVSCLLCGCGGLGATDGGVPLGSTRLNLSGQVVLAANPGQPVSNATLNLLTTGGMSYYGETDAQGSYLFMDLPAGAGIMTVLPPDGSSLARQQLVVDVTPNALKTVVVGLAPAADYAAATGITISPASLSLRIGQTASIAARVLGGGATGMDHPSLVVSGGVGQISPDDVFTATQSGAGLITATFGSQRTAIPVTVQ